ncbi:thioesterase II family protein [Streptacidiphilus sp. EB129]|uniref:thioesterase II family protein n=1 Tax=Streptacidiphilus sp. EB129 TaxID=3156262 RepID=UPI0035178719
MSMAVHSSSELWFRRQEGAAVPALRLVCFPHAGGAASMYRGWRRYLQPEVELLAVRYPGRQDRLAEPAVESMDELAGRVTAALRPYLDRPVALFGHSMGSAVAYEVAARLESEYGVPAALLAVSGRPAPHRAVPSALHHGGDASIIDSLRRLGSTQLQVFDDPDLRELLMPALRADYRLLETYRPSQPPPVRAPIVACAGISDPRCGLDGLRSWAELGTGTFSHRLFPGGHFYTEDCEADLVAHVSKHLTTAQRGA